MACEQTLGPWAALAVAGGPWKQHPISKRVLHCVGAPREVETLIGTGPLPRCFPCGPIVPDLCVITAEVVPLGFLQSEAFLDGIQYLFVQTWKLASVRFFCV